MNAAPQSLSADDMKQFTIPVFDPFSDFLLGSAEEKSYEVSLLDVVRFAGHACPSMVGAFLMTRRAIQELYPESGICIRGEIEIDMPGAPTQGANGPIANVFGFITGAWSETGFGGLQGKFKRRGLLRFNSAAVTDGGVRFSRPALGLSVVLHFDPSRITISEDPSLPFQRKWREKIKTILANPDKVVW